MRTFLEYENGFNELKDWSPKCWVNVQVPDKDDFDFLINKLNVPESLLWDIEDIDERPRTEIEGDWLLTILRIPYRQTEGKIPFITIPVGVFTNGEIVVSVCFFKSELIGDFIEYVRRKEINAANKLDLILRMILSSSVWFLKYLKQINNDINSAEKELERSIRNEDLLRLMNLQKTLVYFNTSIRGNESVVVRLRSIFSDIDYLDSDLLEDVEIELKQASNMVKIYSDILTGTMDAFASIISNNVSTIMKRMTSISIILMVPTLIASFYGMNVETHLEHFDYAFLGIVVLSVLLSCVAFLVFRRIKWF